VKTLKRWLRRATRLRNRCLSTYAIHHAAANGNEEIVDILIRFGCNLELKSNGRVPLSTAVWNSREGVTELLARTKIAIDAQDPGNLTAPLHLAVQNLFHAGMRELLKAGASVDIRNQFQATPLHVATSKGDLSGVKLLLEHGAAVSLRDRAGDSALQIAAVRGFDKVVHVLLDYGAEIDDYDGSRDPRTALVIAVTCNKPAVVRTLLQRGANINLQTKANGKLTSGPLHFAAGNGLLEVAEILLEFKPDLELRDGRNETPLLVASRFSKTEIVQRLLEAGADVEAKVDPYNTPLTKSVLAKNFPLAQLLVDGGASLELRGSRKETLLHHAVAGDDLETIEFLTKNHSDVEAQDAEGMTPLMLAARADHAAGMGILMAYGASIDTQNRMGLTALHFAAGEGSTEAASLLLGCGAEPMIISRRGFTALNLAHGNGHKAIADLMMKALEDAGRVIYDPRWPKTPLCISLEALQHGYEVEDYHGRPVIHILSEPKLRENSTSSFDNESVRQSDDLSHQGQPNMPAISHSTTKQSIHRRHGDLSESLQLASPRLTDAHRLGIPNSDAQPSPQDSSRSSLDSTSSHPPHWKAEQSSTGNSKQNSEQMRQFLPKEESHGLTRHDGRGSDESSDMYGAD
jgi:ankyrin repeat protein